MKLYNVIVVGAGASGLMCAAEAGKRGRSVLIVDHAQIAGNKIRVSGGGRCNFSNLHLSHQNYLSQNPSFCISALKRFGVENFLALIKKYQVSFFEKTCGQLFCSTSSQAIIDVLKFECGAGKVDVQLQTKVFKVEKILDRFYLETHCGKFACESLVIASGGLSMPKLGASDFGHEIARQFGLKLIPPYPALVPLTINNEKLKNLAGLSIESVVSTKKACFRDDLLITHRGLSGPAILQISSYWNKGEKILINLLPDVRLRRVLEEKNGIAENKEIKTILAYFVPKRLAIFLLNACAIDEHKKNLSMQEISLLEKAIHSFELEPTGTEGFSKAEATVGGVSTEEISSKTFECKKMPGLYFIGEVLDVVGHLGGYNLQWAWSSGYAAGQYV